MKKVLLLVGIGVVVFAGTALVTRALFSDTEQSGENKITSGTMDMSVDGSNGVAFDSFDIQNIGETSTTSGSKEWTIVNSGTLPGSLKFSLANISNTENGCNEPELEVENNCAADNVGELGAAAAVTIKVDSNDDGVYDDEPIVVSSTLANGKEPEYANQWNTNAGTVLVQPGQSKKVKLFWSINSDAYGNEVQSDTLGFKVQFNLTQVTAN